MPALRPASPRLVAAALAATLACDCRQTASAPAQFVLVDLAPGARAPRASLFGTDVIGLPNGLAMTPDATPGSTLLELDPHVASAPSLRAGNAVASVLSPDGRTLVVLTSGFNRTFGPDGKLAEKGSSEYVFVYDVASGSPRETQVLMVPNAFGGIAFDPGGAHLYVGGGSDDVLHSFTVDSTGRWGEEGAPILLGHLEKSGYGGLGVRVGPFAAGVAVTASGRIVVVANHENDSVSLIDVAQRRVVREVALAPGGGLPGGEFPAGVLVLGEDRAYVTCQRDREVAVVDLRAGAVTQRIRVGGQPTKLVASRDGRHIYVANANSDTVSVIDTVRGQVTNEIPTAAPDGVAYAALRTQRGSNPNALALSPDGRWLYVTNGGNSTLALIHLDAAQSGSAASKGDDDGHLGRVVGLIPTGFYPNAVALSLDGRHVFVAHGKSPAGPNPLGPWSDVARARVDPYASGVGNQFALQLTHGGLLAFPIPDPETLARLTLQSLRNNHATAARVPPVFDALRGKVTHVIYVIAENRSYDQILGDLAGADGDPSLVHWGEGITPNQHALARGFVTFDRFFDSGGVSGDGWQWSLGGHTTDVAEKAVPIEYAERGHHSHDWEGLNRNVNVGRATLDDRLEWNPKTPRSVNLVPGTADVGAVDGPAEGGRGFLWDAAIAAGLPFRNYGCFVDDARYGLPLEDAARVPPIRHPAEVKHRVAFPTRTALEATTDPFYRGFDMVFADFWRVEEWAREFDGYVASGALPALETIRLPHDHLGSFARAMDGLTTPDTQIADHDYALGLIVERVSQSPYWESTVIVALEDDAQNGSDHVDAQRSFVLFAGGHVRRGAVVSRPYTTVSALRTIELLLGLPPLGQQDAVADPIAEALDTTANTAPFRAIVPSVLRSSFLPLPAPKEGEVATLPRGTREAWSAATAGFDFSHADRVPTEDFNRVVACGLGVVRGCAEPPESSPAKSVWRRRDDDD